MMTNKKIALLFMILHAMIMEYVVSAYKEAVVTAALRGSSLDTARTAPHQDRELVLIWLTWPVAIPLGLVALLCILPGYCDYIDPDDTGDI
jgi:hypothetical protein